MNHTEYRTEWTFSYPANELALAAKAKTQHHTDRLNWWIAKREEKLAEIRASGIEIDESVAAGERDFRISSNYRAPSVQINSSLVEAVHECNQKVSEHRGKVVDYTGWYQVLSAQGGAKYDLNHQDWLFFFGENKVFADGAGA